MALGATPGHVIRAVMGRAFLESLYGVLLGLTSGTALTRVLNRELYEVAVTDPLTFAVACVLLIGVALLAAYIPSRLATRVDPMMALRAE